MRQSGAAVDAMSSLGYRGLSAADEAEEVLDAHGFPVPRDLLTKYQSLQARSHRVQRVDGADRHGRHDWPHLLEQARRKKYRAGGPLPPKFVAAVRNGIPNQHRAEAWLLLSGAWARMEAQPQLYPRLVVAGAPQRLKEMVDLDVPRTFPGHARVASEAFMGRMRRVLLAYAVRNPEVGYCQGMNFVCAAILLFVDDEAAAFWLLSHVVEDVLPDHYVQSMIGHTVDRQVRNTRMPGGAEGARLREGGRGCDTAR